MADLFIHQTFSTKCLKRVKFPNILLTKLSCYWIVRKFGGEKVWWIWRIIRDSPIQISSCNWQPISWSIHLPNFFLPNAQKEQFAKVSSCQTFPLYGIRFHSQGRVSLTTYICACTFYFYLYASGLEEQNYTGQAEVVMDYSTIQWC